jgi:hypothetical protein
MVDKKIREEKTGTGFDLLVHHFPVLFWWRRNRAGEFAIESSSGLVLSVPIREICGQDSYLDSRVSRAALSFVASLRS